MAVFLLVLIIIIAVSIKKRDSEPYLSKSDTCAVNGIFTILIFLSHSTQYYPLNSELILDKIYNHIQWMHNQWVVSTFLAFSGYGVMVRLLESDTDYLRNFWKNRILKFFIGYDIAVCLYVVMNLLMGRKYSVLHIVLSFLSLESIGQSNWYVFAIVLMYLAFFISAKIFRNKKCLFLETKSRHYAALGITFLAVVYLLITKEVCGFESRFYSTIMCFPFDCWLALYRDKIYNYFKSGLRWSVSIAGISVVFNKSLEKFYQSGLFGGWLKK